MDSLKKESSSQQADLDLKTNLLTRKESELFKTMERLNKIEGDYAKMKDANKSLKAENEEHLFTFNRQKQAESHSRGDSEAQLAKLRDLLTHERQARTEAEEGKAALT